MGQLFEWVVTAPASQREPAEFGRRRAIDLAQRLVLIVPLDRKDSGLACSKSELVVHRGWVLQMQVHLAVQKLELELAILQQLRKDFVESRLAEIVPGRRGLAVIQAVLSDRRETESFVQPVDQRASCWTVSAAQTTSYQRQPVLPVPPVRMGSGQTLVYQRHPKIVSVQERLSDQRQTLSAQVML